MLIGVKSSEMSAACVKQSVTRFQQFAFVRPRKHFFVGFFFFFFCNFTSISEFILPCCYPAGFAAASIDTAVLAIDKQQQHNNANNIDGNGVFGRLLQLTENK